MQESISVQSCIRGYHKTHLHRYIYGQQYSMSQQIASTFGSNCTVLSSARALCLAGWLMLVPVGLLQQFLEVLVSQTVSLLGLEDHPCCSDNVDITFSHLDTNEIFNKIFSHNNFSSSQIFHYFNFRLWVTRRK